MVSRMYLLTDCDELGCEVSLWWWLMAVLYRNVASAVRHIPNIIHRCG